MWNNINGATYSAHTWYYIAIMWDCDDTYFKFYIDGVDVSIAHGDEQYYLGDPNEFNTFKYLEFAYDPIDRSTGQERYADLRKNLCGL